MKGASNEPSNLPEAHWRRNSGGRPMQNSVEAEGSGRTLVKATGMRNPGLASRKSFSTMVLKTTRLPLNRGRSHSLIRLPQSE